MKKTSTANTRNIPGAKIDPVGHPVEIKDGIATEKVYFQTRNVISLDINENLLAEGESFSLKNETTDATLLENETLNLGRFTDFEVTANLQALNQEARLADSFVLKLWPSDSEYLRKFTYGLNALKLTVNDGSVGKFATYSVTLKDYSIFDLGTSSFDENLARKAGIEVAPAMFVTPVMSNGNQSLTIGTINMMSR